MSAELERSSPYFQKLQKQFAAYIRDPENCPYAPAGEKSIEPRRLEAYQSLFFNNLASFFSQIFPVTLTILGELRWQEIIREYMIKHDAKTPLFHELGEEFLAFLEREFEPRESDPAFLLELAHYEWVELALSVSTEQGFTGGETFLKKELRWNQKYQLSPVAWPLAYEWPVHRLSLRYQPEQVPKDATTLLVYRTLVKSDLDEGASEKIEFIELSPLLYQFLVLLESIPLAQTAFEEVAKPYYIPENQLQAFAEQTLQELVMLNILRPMC